MGWTPRDRRLRPALTAAATQGHRRLVSSGSRSSRDHRWEGWRAAALPRRRVQVRRTSAASGSSPIRPGCSPIHLNSRGGECGAVEAVALAGEHCRGAHLRCMELQAESTGLQAGVHRAAGRTRRRMQRVPPTDSRARKRPPRLQPCAIEAATLRDVGCNSPTGSRRGRGRPSGRRSGRSAPARHRVTASIARGCSSIAQGCSLYCA